MRILIAPDKFKGSLSAQAVCNAIEKGILQKNPTAQIIKLPLADGGDGTLTILKKYIKADKINVISVDALGKSIEAYYLLHDNIAYVELAIASGLVHLKPSERNPLKTHNRGTGILIKDALAKGAKKIVLCLGGSATTEAGLSIAAELGYLFFDRAGKAIQPTGGNLLDITSYQKNKEFKHVEFDVLCDVTNPLHGPNGAAFVFAPQKGADQKAVAFLDKGLQHIARLIEEKTSKNINTIVGAGAAGGIAGGLSGLFNTRLINGFDFIAKLADLEIHLQKSDIVITGEGKVDHSSLQGKVVGKMEELCTKHQKPLIIIAGGSTIENDKIQHTSIKNIKTITELSKNERDAILNAASYIEKMASEV